MVRQGQAQEPKWGEGGKGSERPGEDRRKGGGKALGQCGWGQGMSKGGDVWKSQGTWQDWLGKSAGRKKTGQRREDGAWREDQCRVGAGERCRAWREETGSKSCRYKVGRHKVGQQEPEGAEEEPWS